LTEIAFSKAIKSACKLERRIRDVLAINTNEREIEREREGKRGRKGKSRGYSTIPARNWYLMRRLSGGLTHIYRKMHEVPVIFRRVY